MNEDKITVKMNYCINPLMAQHVHIGGEFSIKPGQTAEQAWDVALERIEEYYQKRFGTTPPKEFVAEPVDKIQGNVLGDIKSCKELKVLQSYKFIVKNKPELEAAYNDMEEKLKNN